MAGHSKWANIKHHKARQDAARSKIWTKLIRELTVAARLGGPEVADNPRLRAAVDKALGSNMTRDTIDRAIARGVGGVDGAHVEELSYEGYGAGGVAIYVEAMTDNRNRTVSEVRYAFNKCGGNLGTDGSVAFLFRRQGVITFAPGAVEDAVLEVALDAGADDVVAHDDGSITVTTTPELLMSVVDALQARHLVPELADIDRVPTTTVPCDIETAEKVLRLIDMLEDLDDVQNVYSNAELPASML